MVNNKASTFHVQDFHTGTGSVYKDKNISVLYILPHLVGHHSTEGVKTTTHICGMSIQVILHRRGKAEHATGGLKATVTATSLHPKNRSVLCSPRRAGKSHRKSVWQRYPDKNQNPVCSPWIQGLARVAFHARKPVEQIRVSEAAGLLTCSANNKTSPRSSAGWRSNL